MLGQILLVGYSPKDDTETGQVVKYDLMTGLGMGASLKEYRASPDAGPCTVTAISGAPDLSSPYVAMLNSCAAALNYSLLHKERPVQRYFGQDRLASIACSPNGECMAAGNEKGVLMVWQISSGELLARIEDAHYQRIDVTRWSTDGGLLVSGSRDGSAKVWSFVAMINGHPACVQTIADHANAVSDVFVGFGLARNARLLTASRDRTVRMYDMIDGQLLAVFDFPSAISRITMNASETMIYAGSEDGSIYLVDLSEEQKSSAISYDTETQDRMVLSGHVQGINGLLFSMDETHLISTDPTGTIIIWNSANRQIARRIEIPKTLTSHTLTSIQVVLRTSLDAPADALQIAQPKRTLAVDRSVLARPSQPEKTNLSSSNPTIQQNDVEMLRENCLGLFDLIAAKIAPQ